MTFSSEADFEEALIKILASKGWEPDVIKYPTEEDLLRNWAQILFENNRQIDRLNDYPLTDSEMQQILEQIKDLKSPLKLNGFINGKTVSITRDNPDDKAHFGKEISLKIYDRQEIAAGQSRYQIVQQPKFKAKSSILNDRRGDLMLLINGMPVIHIELKKSGIPVSQASNQIEKYMKEGIFTGIFSLVQVFVAMEPEETIYFANPGMEGKFNKDFFFHWADFNNEPINDYDKVAESLLSIPMAHQLIGFYTVADDADGVLKVMRSYQYFAASRISDTVSKASWDGKGTLGGYIWHTTGSGKTMTSFKSAQLIAHSKDADKVVFLMDRIELGTQSLKEYRAFADEAESVQETEDTEVLVSKLISTDPANTLIVTSIQKMSRIKDEANKKSDIETIANKKVVFVVDEAHRSTFGDMLITIKRTFPKAMFFGFTGTPIQEENQRKMNTTATVFGNELHRYSIADGIREKNVLGFDPYKVLTFKDKDLRKVVALDMAKAASIDEVFSDPKKEEIFNHYMDATQVAMVSQVKDDGTIEKGIEDYIPKSQYRTKEHQGAVVRDIVENFPVLSHNGKFHAIFAATSIPEAIEYYRLLKDADKSLKVTALFDPSIDNSGGQALTKEDGLVELLEDYNARYKKEYTIPTFAAYKKDLSARLAHKKPYDKIAGKKEEQIDILVVVDQMLTGFDSKWINTLYMDKLMRYENIIQAFSRTNRLFGPDKPFGTIRYYRKPHTMEVNIEKAIKLYSGDKPLGLFAQRLEHNLNKMNSIFKDIKDIFEHAQVVNFEKLPADKEEKAKFANLFNTFNAYLEAAKIQGFEWDQLHYEFNSEYSDDVSIVDLLLDEQIYYVLVLRYKELFGGGGSGGIEDVPYDIEGYITEIDTGVIDSNYMNSRFTKYIKILSQDNVKEEEVQQTLDDLHKSFASLTQEQQKYAGVFLHDVQGGIIQLEEGKTFIDYVVEYIENAKNDQIHRVAIYLGLLEPKLREIMESGVNEDNLNEFGRFDAVKATVDKTKAKEYFEAIEGKTLPLPIVNVRVDNLLRDFILNDDFELKEP